MGGVYVAKSIWNHRRLEDGSVRGGDMDKVLYINLDIRICLVERDGDIQRCILYDCWGNLKSSTEYVLEVELKVSIPSSIVADLRHIIVSIGFMLT